MYRLAIATLFVLAGCATPEYVPITSFAVEPEITAPQAAPSGLTLGVRPLEAGRPYRQPVAYRDKGFILGALDNFEWAELPRDIVTRALVDAITATGKYSDVGLAAFMARPDLTLTGQLRKFDLNRATEPWTAEVETSLTLRKSLQPEAVWSATLTAQAPLETNDIKALPQAMSNAVADLATKAATAIAATNVPAAE